MRNKIITNPLKKRRVMLGLTQGQVSSQLGITQSQYSRLEKSESDPTKYLVRLSQIFGCDHKIHGDFFDKIFIYIVCKI